MVNVVINQALAVAGKALDITLEILVAPQGKAPGTLNRALAETGFQVVARHDGKCMRAPFIGGSDLEMSEIVSYVRIIVVLSILRNPIPRLDIKHQVALFKNEVGKDAVPTPGQGFRPAVGLVVEANQVYSILDPPEGPFRAELDPGFRLIVRLAEWG